MKKILLSLLLSTTLLANIGPFPPGGGGGGGGSGTVTSVGLADSGAGIFTVAGTNPVTTSGTITLALTSGLQNRVLATPAGAPGAPTVRLLVGNDLPNPSASTLGGIESIAAVSHQWINTISTAGAPSLSQPDFTDLSGHATVAQGGTGLTTLTTYALMAAGTTSTGNMQQITAANVSGNILVSQGSSALPVWQAPASGGISGSGTSGKHVKWNGSSSVTNATWAEGSNGEFQYQNYASAKGSASIPIVDMDPGVGIGMYTNANQSTILTGQGVASLYAVNGSIYVPTAFYLGNDSTTHTSWIDGNSSNLNLNGYGVGSAINQKVNGTIATQAYGDAGGTYFQMGRAVYTHSTTQSGTSYTVINNDHVVLMTNAAARAVTLPTPSSAEGDGWEVYIKDAANTALSANITISVPSGKKMNTTTNGTFVINTNGGGVKLYYDGTDFWSIAYTLQ